MMDWMRGPSSVAALALVAVALAGCSMSPPVQTVNTLNSGTPVPNSTVATGTLPPLGTPGQPTPSLSGTPVLGGAPQPDPTLQANTNTGITTTPTLDPSGNLLTTGGRDLTGGLTIDKLLGGWTLASGATQCQLNLTYTAKEGTARYRASTPGCGITGLAAVGSWQLAGSQVQLFDEGGTMVAALVLSGNRFIGTSAGGAAITMSA
jgi:hypothetical protein